jgi:hypothetical protein
MYSLNCEWYMKEFPSIDLLLKDIVSSGMDPNYEVTLDGSPTGDIAIDLIIP